MRDQLGVVPLVGPARGRVETPRGPDGEEAVETVVLNRAGVFELALKADTPPAPLSAGLLRAMPRIWVGTNVYDGLRKRYEATAKLAEHT